MALDTAVIFLPSLKVGGDFVDVIRRPDREETMLLLGDVSGKGFDSAFVSLRIERELREMAREPGHPPTILARRINQSVCAELDGRMPFTLFIGCLTERRLRYLSAGHDSAVLLHKERAEYLPATMPLLGFAGDVECVEQEVALEPGDMIFIYSDGLRELCYPESTPRNPSALAADLAFRRERAQTAADIAQGLTDRIVELTGLVGEDTGGLLPACARRPRGGSDDITAIVTWAH